MSATEPDKVKVNLSLTAAAAAALDELAPHSRARGATVSALILAEHERRNVASLIARVQQLERVVVDLAARLEEHKELQVW